MLCQEVCIFKYSFHQKVKVVKKVTYLGAKSFSFNNAPSYENINSPLKKWCLKWWLKKIEMANDEACNARDSRKVLDMSLITYIHTLRLGKK